VIQTTSTTVQTEAKAGRRAAYKARGMGGIHRRGLTCRFYYSVNGRQQRESSGSRKRSVAEQLLRTRLEEAGRGGFVSPTAARRVTVDAARGPQMWSRLVRRPEARQPHAQRGVREGGVGMVVAVDPAGGGERLPVRRGGAVDIAPLLVAQAGDDKPGRFDDGRRANRRADSGRAARAHEDSGGSDGPGPGFRRR
jgi:hypothetical protein